LVPERAHRTRFSGLEPFEITPDSGFVTIGERTNVTGSARFRRLIESGNHQAAVDVALDQVRGGANLLECCRKFGTRKVIYSSTGGCVYGDPVYLPADEKHPLQPRDPYGASKASFELYLPVWEMNYGLNFTILRYPNVYGPRQDPFGEAGVVSIFIGQMLRGIQPIINGDGEQLRDYVFISDVVRANRLVLDRGDNDIFNVGWGKGTSVNQIFHALCSILGSEVPEVHGPAKLGEIKQTYLDSRKSAEVLGWRPEVDLSEGLKRTVEFFRPIIAAHAVAETANSVAS